VQGEGLRAGILVVAHAPRPTGSGARLCSLGARTDDLQATPCIEARSQGGRNGAAGSSRRSEAPTERGKRGTERSLVKRDRRSLRRERPPHGKGSQEAIRRKGVTRRWEATIVRGVVKRRRLLESRVRGTVPARVGKGRVEKGRLRIHPGEIQAGRSIRRYLAGRLLHPFLGRPSSHCESVHATSGGRRLSPSLESWLLSSRESISTSHVPPYSSRPARTLPPRLKDVSGLSPSVGTTSGLELAHTQGVREAQDVAERRRVSSIPMIHAGTSRSGDDAAPCAARNRGQSAHDGLHQIGSSPLFYLYDWRDTVCLFSRRGVFISPWRL